MHVTASLGLRLHHRQKHFVGRIERGFDFLGYRFHPARGLRPSAESLRRLLARARRLHEQGAGGRRRQYVARWTRWLWAGLSGMISRKGGARRYYVTVLKRLRLTGAYLPRM